MMHRTLSIIKFSLLWFLFGSYSIVEACSYASLGAKIRISNTLIDTTHATLETTVEAYYNTNIKPLLEEIDKIQVDIAKTVVHMRTLDKEANLDDRKLLFLLNKNQSQLHIVEEK